ncbi:MAG: hypothetical protein BME93_05775 [Methanosarcinales archaeon Met12]|nr:MAG: hypothetical protein BME93_05775 [Methanosarcinales archaeon Met12]
MKDNIEEIEENLGKFNQIADGSDDDLTKIVKMIRILNDNMKEVAENIEETDERLNEIEDCINTIENRLKQIERDLRIKKGEYSA